MIGANVSVFSIGKAVGRGGGGGSLPTATILHLENPATNFSSNSWTASVGSNPSFSGAFATGTDGNGNSYLQYSTDSQRTSYGSLASVTLPSNMCIISVVEEEGSRPFIAEHSTNANAIDGMYQYSNTGFTYGVKRAASSSALVGYNPLNSAGSSTEDPVSNATKTIFGSNLKSDNSMIGMFYSSKFGGKRNGTISTGSAISHSNTTNTLYIGSRGGTQLMFTGKLYEVYITEQLTDEQFDQVIAYFETKYNL